VFVLWIEFEKKKYESAVSEKQQVSGIGIAFEECLLLFL
jgi:hypothetical protein